MRQPDASGYVALRTRTNPVQVFSLPSRCSAILLILLLAGCTGPRLVEYLPSAQGLATQEEVQRDMGPPLRIFPPDKSGEIWIYRELNYSHNPPFGVSTCVEYVLTFDRKQTLQEWTVKEWPPQSCR